MQWIAQLFIWLFAIFWFIGLIGCIIKRINIVLVELEVSIDIARRLSRDRIQKKGRRVSMERNAS